MSIIALSGWKGSGKDLAGQYLVQQHNYARMAFADVLKDTVAEQYNIPRTWCDNPEKKELPLVQYPVNNSDAFVANIHSLLVNELKHGYWTPRALCILEGSIKRAVNSNHWVNKVIDNIMNTSGTTFVITDLRYRSEIELLRKQFGKDLVTVRINRFETVNTEDPSERDLDKAEFDVVINNRNGKQELYNELDSLMKGLK
jgi:hypothetical protein